MHSTEVLVVLGSPNSSNGELSDIAKSRLDGVNKLYAAGKRILCTGGWGNHFNTTPKAHAEYAWQYLLKKGIPEQAFLEQALSSNTVDDAVKSKMILSKLDNPHITIVTSDFHLERVKLIFKKILPAFEIQFIGVSSAFLTTEQKAAFVAHEQTAIRSIQANGLYF
jgi:uncharacterized SAM-binding protein YcdF (DUF218 family)